eukprot:121414-Heterocapsa_arctica.AAC.2
MSGCLHGPGHTKVLHCPQKSQVQRGSLDLKATSVWGSSSETMQPYAEESVLQNLAPLLRWLAGHELAVRRRGKGDLR